MWYSILPESLTELESWIARFFFILGTLTIGPWFLLLLYDVLLYIWRASTYEIPIIGGRAMGRHRPVAPTLSERPDGRRRTLSLTGEKVGNDNDNNANDVGKGDGGVRERKTPTTAQDPLEDEGVRDRRVQTRVQGDTTGSGQAGMQER